MTFAELLSRKTIIIGDGALGTQLQACSEKPVDLPEVFTLDLAGQKLITQIHQSYIRSGGQILETNTFAANPFTLSQFGLDEQCEKINRSAILCAKEAVESDTLVVGSVGPLNLALALTDFTENQITEIYYRQMAILAECGVDGIFLETFSSSAEARGALSASVKCNLPVGFLMGGLAICQPYSRGTVLELIKLAKDFSACALGINCVAPYDLSRLLPVLAERSDLPLMAYPNAGTPTVVRGAVRYDLAGQVLLTEAAMWAEQGVAVLGGCCGTTPEHIAQLKKSFGGKTVSSRAPKSVSVSVSHLSSEKKELPKNPIREKMLKGYRPLTAVEIRPSLSRPLRQTIESAKILSQLKPDFFDIPDNAGANPARDCIAAAHLLQSELNIPTIIHKSATQSNMLQIHSSLLGASELGIQSVLAVTGDPPHVGLFDRYATRVTDVRSSVELIRLLTLLRQGQLINAQPLPVPVDFVIGCGYAPTVNLTAQTEWLKRKVQAGAEYVFTQPMFLLQDFQAMKEATASLDIPIFIGIFPIVSAKQVSYLRSGKIPGIVIPDRIAERIQSFADQADQLKAGMEIAETLIQQIRKQCDGFYLIMPFHPDTFSLTAGLLRMIRT
jgi:homocysteine S-methyltransferase